LETSDFTLQSEHSSKMQRLEQNRPILLKYVQDNIIGTWSDQYQLKTVYGSKPLVYADYTASGRALKFIEEYIQHEILPMYANTHTQQSGTGKQTNNAREESRAIVKRVCGANEDDALIFVGNGTTVSL
jgi:selenocysteine lyase/cysteine desulfurase